MSLRQQPHGTRALGCASPCIPRPVGTLVSGAKIASVKIEKCIWLSELNFLFFFFFELFFLNYFKLSENPEIQTKM